MHARTFETKNVVTAMLDGVLAGSPADETELVWFERRHGSASWPPAPSDRLEAPRLSVLVRTVEGGRPGWHRTEVRHRGEIENAVRYALAVAKTQPRVRRRPVLPTPTGAIERPARLFDRAVMRLDVDSARERVRGWCAASEDGIEASGRLRWSETRLLVANSHDVRRATTSTELDFDVQVGEGAGCGRASASARTFADLKPEAVAARARQLAVAGGTPLASAPAGGPLLLAPEAAVQLLDLLNMFALAGRAYLDGTSILVEHRNEQIFDRSVHLVDDGRRHPGVPFPFDLEGSPKVACELIVEGRPSTPALTHHQGAEAGLVPTAQSIGGQDALFGNLFLEPGELDQAALLREAEGGLFVGWLEPAECLEPKQLHFRSIARSLRRIENGALGAPVADQRWEASLLTAFGRLRGLGADPVARAVRSTPLGAISAPSVVLAEGGGLTALA